MKIGHSTGTLFKSRICARSRFGLTLVIVFIVISSPVLMLVNPASAAGAAPSYSTIGSPSAPSTIGQDGADFTAQAALSGVSARQTNNIVGAQSYYDVVFTTTTTGTIKFIDITFPAGILIGAAPQLAEREGIGAGTAAKTSNTEIRYTVSSAVSVPAGTKIRLEFFNLVNPTSPSNIYKVTVTTRTAGGTTIDGPTSSNSLNMKQISTQQIAPDAIVPEMSQITSGAVNVPPQSHVRSELQCPLSHPKATGGGFIVPDSGTTFPFPPYMHASSSTPVSGGFSWSVVMYNSHPTETLFFFVRVNCIGSMP